MTQDEMMEIFQAAIMLAFKLAVPRYSSLP